MSTRLVALSLVVFGATIFVSSAQAQRRVAGVRRGGARIGFVRPRSGGAFFAGSAFDPYYYSDYDSEPENIEAPPREIIIVSQAAPSASAAPVPDAHESMVLELQGDHWVRIRNSGELQTGGQSEQPGSAQASNLPSAIPPATPRRTDAQEPPAALPTAVLVFRDGHTEEIGKYAIIGATIHANADYWTSGSWTRQIQIAELDVPATLKLNQERGSNFRLPSGPNEVMIRP
jgi:hypothetical protein